MKDIREQKGISLRDLALEADLSANTISEIELGKRDPRMTTVVKLASALGIDPADLLPKL
ncbi:MAG TPA: helix-turn-helix transcriptional regulator [Puia sp.]|nr:helix-turn-helix transcriptional regulator [Puia sp.]